MTKFEIASDDFQIPFKSYRDRENPLTAAQVFDKYLQRTVLGETVLATFDTVEEAKEAFKGYADMARTRVESSFSGQKLLTGTVVWLQEVEYDADGEFASGGDIWEFAAEPYAGIVYDEEEDDDDEES